MIRERRVGHLRAFQSLLLILPLLILLSYLFRPQLPVQGEIPEQLAARLGILGSTNGLQTIVNRQRLEVGLQSTPQGEILLVRPHLDDLYPGLLLYLEPAGGDQADWVLMGKLSDGVLHSFRLPDLSDRLEGHFVLFSLPRGETVDRIPATLSGAVN